MKSDTAIIITYTGNMKEIPAEAIKKGISYYQAETQEVLDHIIFLKNSGISKDFSDFASVFYCSSKECLNFLENLKSFSRLYKELEQYRTYDDKTTSSKEVIHINLGGLKKGGIASLSKIFIKGDLSKKIRGILT